MTATLLSTWGFPVGRAKWMIAAMAAALAAPASAAPVAPDQNATGEVLILVPLTLTKLDDLDFGSAVTSSTSGMIAIDPATSARTLAGGVTGIPSDPGHRARFAGAGSPNQQVIVTVIPPAALANGTGDLIPLLALTVEGGPIHTIDATTRTFLFGVGGIIMVNANQPEGVYQATFNVTANYQ